LNIGIIIVYLRVIKSKITIMNTGSASKGRGKTGVSAIATVKSSVRPSKLTKFSPAWVVVNSKDAPGYQMEVIDRIRDGVKKADWKQLINNIDSTEKEFENVLPASISSMQKKAVYSKETSERIYEVARLFGLGYDVFDTKEDFKNWLMTPSTSLGDKMPFDLLDSSFGFEMVQNEIIRIQYNVYS